MQTVTISLSGYFTSGYPVMGPFASYPQTYDVPSGHNLVIESMSAVAGVPKGQSANLWLDVADQKKGDTFATYYIPLQFQATYSTNPTTRQSRSATGGPWITPCAPISPAAVGSIFKAGAV
jgi:hypothetical protein